MNLLFRLFILLGSLVVLLLFAALIVPYFIDWDEFTSEFETQASRVVGQEVKVGGRIVAVFVRPSSYYRNVHASA